ncbi:GMC oxidoreductase [Nocardioides mangrovicus]|uniref:GMC oxidoreductase n=1 Tax=Nocardioides mangrovicus TaxID=2478913 RepID=UPI001313E494|nr:GMC family oxidoreductase [Nocardioides mangrovicus]
MSGYDVVVVGLGAAGTIATRRLAESGLRVLALEAGGSYASTDFLPDQLLNQRRGALTSGKTAAEMPTVRRDVANVAVRPPFGGLTMNAVGGTKIHSGNGHLRLPPWQFRSRSNLLERYGEQVLPPEISLADWPVTFDDVVPFYDELELVHGVSGEPGPERFVGPRTQPYPNPPLRRSGYNELMTAAASRLGWTPFATPAAIRSRPYGGRGACTYCGQCVFNGCYADAKGVLRIEDVLGSRGSVEVRTHARVTRVLTGSDGTATGVEIVADGSTTTETVRARAVMLAAYTYENVRLLHLSAGGDHPSGLGNSTDQLGRHFSTHAFGFAFGSFGGREMNTWTGSMSQAVSVEEFNADHVDHTDLGFVGGGSLLAMMEKLTMLMARQPPPSAGRWGEGYKRWLAEDFRSMAHVHFWADEMPHRDGRLDLDPTHVDPTGTPVLRITKPLLENDARSFAYLAEQGHAWLREAGASETWSSPYHPFDISPHAFGGARMGDDPATNVTDSWQRLHDAANVYVLGGATWPSSTGTNPTPTIEALAMRSAGHLVEELS